MILGTMVGQMLQCQWCLHRCVMCTLLLLVCHVYVKVRRKFSVSAFNLYVATSMNFKQCRDMCSTHRILNVLKERKLQHGVLMVSNEITRLCESWSAGSVTENTRTWGNRQHGNVRSIPRSWNNFWVMYKRQCSDHIIGHLHNYHNYSCCDNEQTKRNQHKAM